MFLAHGIREVCIKLHIEVFHNLSYWNFTVN